ncbi:hypothetical protein [Streptomyces sp. DH37]|uniref:hypothetical protein n=1 Tax=Streptomyces sp. DH37 TaxID=3040122 RepID=UPI002442DFAD|nr:hypothetical protein [Streptomyces sp. DH37]MDG9701722.1 hypothetical protein [Streptomyces sp. DH37]
MTTNLFGPDRTRLGYEDQEWAVWISGMDDIHQKDSAETALADAADYNATFAQMALRDDRSEYDPVLYAVVLHRGYAWSPSVEHRNGRDCGLVRCVHCGTDRNIAAKAGA